MHDWNSWLNSSNTIIVLKAINERKEELKEVVTNGCLLQEKNTDKIALDFTLTLGQIEGLGMAIDLIKEIEEKESDN